VIEKKKIEKDQILTIIFASLILIAFFLPISTGSGFMSFDSVHSFNIINIIKILLGITTIVEGASISFMLPFYISCLLLVLVFLSTLILIVLTIKRTNASLRLILSVCIFVTLIMGGMMYNTTLTSIAKTGNNFYQVYPEFKLVVKSKAGSPNSWAKGLEELYADADTVFVNGEDTNAIRNTITDLIDLTASIDYTASDSEKKSANYTIFSTLKEIIPVEQQESIFLDYFKRQTKSVTAISSTFSMFFFLSLIAALAMVATSYSDRNKNSRITYGIKANCMYIGITAITLFISLLLPIFQVSGDTTGGTGLAQALGMTGLVNLSKVFQPEAFMSSLGIVSEEFAFNKALLILAALFYLLSIASMVVFIYLAATKKMFKIRRIFAVAVPVFLAGMGLLIGKGASDMGIGFSVYYYLAVGISIAGALLPFTAYSDHEKYKVFSIVNTIIFILICGFIFVPLWKVLVDSLDSLAGYGMKMWPQNFSLEGYKTFITNPALSRPFLISIQVTIIGTFIGLALSTLGAYVLIQYDMPGRNFLAWLLLFTLIFQGGMIPLYLVLQDLGLLNSLWAVLLPASINVYNLVLMRNFFEGIPKSLFEAASIDGCSPIKTFFKIVLPLSKAALASIGLMFAVAFWNDYTNFKLYISNSNLYNFQMKLRDMIFSSDMPNSNMISENTLQSAAIMVAIIPFMIIYPFLQKYFVHGVNVGAVKE